MNRSKRIKNILEEYFTQHKIIVTDNSYQHKGHNNFDGTNETHFLIKIKQIKKIKYNLLSTHRLINKVLEDEFKKGLHSLEIKIIK